jgi:hypothetical protein
MTNLSVSPSLMAATGPMVVAIALVLVLRAGPARAAGPVDPVREAPR